MAYRSFYILLKLLVSVSLFGLSSCGGEDDTPSTDEIFISKLVEQPWEVQSVIHETDGDLTYDYEEFVTNFNKNGNHEYDGALSTENGFLAFPNASYWRLVEEAGVSYILRSDGVYMAYELTEASLNLEFTLPQSSIQRVAGVAGKINFSLTHIQ
ncbi:hypothetical protein [Sediminitomix flava]|uniref:Lipocalin-like protein n=1 Tax=Sediminitomix flava TaxID=379075 RepID=A0A315ZB33_SEDFL|nr:hypothetical protein [Sediminitomix flava]PWJ42263.1 hypothetical protein BC781_103515 [Sediminitomix flava]